MDLIIMGATGRTGLVQVLLGSTTRRLLRSLPCSLLIVKQEDMLEELFESDVRVMGTVCRAGIPGFIIGNTAECVLDVVDCSVLVFKPEGFVSPVAPLIQSGRKRRSFA